MYIQTKMLIICNNLSSFHLKISKEFANQRTIELDRHILENKTELVDVGVVIVAIGFTKCV